MKKMFKRVSSLLLILILMFSLSVPAFAAELNFLGRKTNFSVNSDNMVTATDLFGNFKSVMPGDTLTEIVTITNLAVDCDYIKLYIRAVAHGAQNAPLIGEDIAKMNDFLSQLSMEVYQGTKLIYSGSPDTLDGFANNVYLGQFRKNQGTQLTVNLQVPSSLGNEYANMAGEVDWVFTVESYNEAGKLIQTGQMNWPVPVLLGLGVLALAAGLFMVSRKRKDNV